MLIGVEPLGIVSTIGVDVQVSQTEGVHTGTGPAAQNGVGHTLTDLVGPVVAVGSRLHKLNLASVGSALGGLVHLLVEVIDGLGHEVGVSGQGVLDGNSLVADAVAVVVGYVTGFQSLVEGLSEQLLGQLGIVTGDGVHSSIQVSILGGVNTVEVTQNLLGGVGLTVGSTGGGIIDIGLADDGVSTGTGGADGSSEQLLVVGNGNSLPEVQQGHGLQVSGGLIEAGVLLTVADGFLVTVQDHEEDGIGGSIVAVLGVPVGSHVVSLQAVGHQLTLQEHHLVGCGVGHHLGVDLGGLIHGVGLAVGGIGVNVLTVGPAVPGIILDKVHSLVGLVGAHLVGAVGAGGLQAGVVGAGPNALGLLDAGVVQVGLDQPVAGQAVQQVEAGQGLLQNQGDLVLVAGEAADQGVIGGSVVLVVVLVGNSLVQGVGAIGEEVDVVGDQHLAGESVIHVLAVDGLIVDGNILGKCIALSIGVLSGSIPESVHVDVNVLACSHHSLSVSVGDHLVQVLGEGVVVLLSTGNGQIGGAEVVSSTVVQQTGIQQALHGLNVVHSLDGGAVIEGGVGVQLDGVSKTGGSGFGDTELGMGGLDLLGHIHRLLSSHLGDDCVGGEGLETLYRMMLIVEHEGVQSGSDVVLGIGVIVGLIGMGIPVGGQSGHRIRVGVLSSFGALGGFGAGIAGCCGVVRGGSLGASGHTQNQGSSQQQCKQLFHFLFLHFHNIYTAYYVYAVVYPK